MSCKRGNPGYCAPPHPTANPSYSPVTTRFAGSGAEKVSHAEAAGPGRRVSVEGKPPDASTAGPRTDRITDRIAWPNRNSAWENFSYHRERSSPFRKRLYCNASPVPANPPVRGGGELSFRFTETHLREMQSAWAAAPGVRAALPPPGSAKLASRGRGCPCVGRRTNSLPRSGRPDPPGREQAPALR